MHNKAKLCHFSLGYKMMAASVLFSCISRADIAYLKLSSHNPQRAPFTH